MIRAGDGPSHASDDRRSEDDSPTEDHSDHERQKFPVRRFPANWEPCEAVWLAWPHNLDTWPGHFQGIPEAFALFAKAIAESVPVRLLADGPLVEEAHRMIGTCGNVEFIDIATNDCWIRDYGPTFVIEDGLVLAVDWDFNAWGGKYHPHDLDRAAGHRIAQAAGLRCLRAEMTLEGGALETDGGGRLLVHSACILDPDRNPKLTKQECARRLNQYLGVQEIVWIDGGLLPGDDTDGHIDQLARFIDTENVVVAVASDSEVPFAAALEANVDQLKLWSRETSPGVTVHRLPGPPPRQIDGHNVPQSYCNFLRIGPDRMLVPTFANRASDDKAIGILRDLCPGVSIEGVACEKIAWGLGALHCASCHQVAAPK